MLDLTGRVAVITGGNSGIGFAIARGVLKAGARVAIWGRRAEKNASAVDALSEFGEVAAFECDVGDEAAVVAAVEQTLQRFEFIDACFANAGYTRVAPFLHTSVRQFEELLRVNLTGTFLTFREVAKAMVARGEGGKLIGLSSIGGLDHGMPMQPGYSATKAGIAALVRSAAVELARHNIQANTLVPGWVETPATAPARSMEKLDTAIVKRTPARRWGDPKDLEGVAVYLASRASDFHTGDVLRVDGGYTKF